MKQATARAAANWRRVYAVPVASVYPSYIAKAEKKGRTRAEVDEIFHLLTGHSQASLEAEFAKKTSFEDFFDWLQRERMYRARELLEFDRRQAGRHSRTVRLLLSRDVPCRARCKM